MADPNRRSSERQDRREERRLTVAELRDRLQRAMTTYAGVLRDGAGLAEAARGVAAVRSAFDAAADPADPVDAGSAAGREASELQALLVVARAVVTAAGERRESRGCHHRLDFPEPHQPLERIVHFGPDRRVRVPASVALSERER